ncbi:FecR domain-containing protein [Alistipes sp. kh20]|uniref:FecR family protein n=1 Tax=Alistipes montrealensis TaxID=2834113 RepID=UPI001BCE9BCC|nr:FecR domain-containing protein [Alistipes montrealensis]MBS4765444.1 FecR domain-containing protein [Alistipes montrealensis]
MQKEIDRLINSYRSNTLNKEEAGMLAEWLEESDENRAYFRACLTGRELPASAKAEQEWARFAARNKILFAVPGGAKTHRRIFRRYIAAAAAVAIGVCAVWFWQRTPGTVPVAGTGTEISAAQPLEYRTARGEKRDIVLPDGSTVCMNSEATLTLDPGFGKATREIEFDGEAFFTITPDKNCPFIIHSANNNYTVLGTSFNLQSYARENFAVVTLHTGCLQAQVKKDVIILDPNEELQIDATANTISKRAVRIDDSIGWIEGRLVFSGYPLKDVANKLSRYYQVKINIHDEIANLQYTGVVDRETLPEALRMISETSPVRLSITNIDGEYFLSRAKRK